MVFGDTPTKGKIATAAKNYLRLAETRGLGVDGPSAAKASKSVPGEKASDMIARLAALISPLFEVAYGDAPAFYHSDSSSDSEEAEEDENSSESSQDSDDE